MMVVNGARRSLCGGVDGLRRVATCTTVLTTVMTICMPEEISSIETYLGWWWAQHIVALCMPQLDGTVQNKDGENGVACLHRKHIARDRSLVAEIRK